MKLLFQDYVSEIPDSNNNYSSNPLLRSALYESLKTLSKDEKLIINLRFYSGLLVYEIANLLSLKERTVQEILDLIIMRLQLEMKINIENKLNQEKEVTNVHGN